MTTKRSGILLGLVFIALVMTAAFLSSGPPQAHGQGNYNDVNARQVQLLEEQNRYLARITTAVESIDRTNRNRSR